MHRRPRHHRISPMLVVLSCVLAGLMAAQPVVAAAEPIAGKTAVELDDVDRYIAFNGTTQWAQATSTSFDIVNDFSFSAWVRHDTTCSGATQICRVMVKDRAYGVFGQGGVWKYQFHNGSIWTEVSTGVSIRAGEWTHLALTRNKTSGVVTFYVNGSLVHTGSYSSALGTTTDIVSIGGYAEASTLSTTSQPFDGDIDEVRLWNVVRTEAEIRSDMHTWGPTDTNGLVAYWDFNELSNSFARNLATGSSAAPASASMSLVNRPTKTDVKVTTTSGSDTVITFPRSYLTSVGGWTVPSGVTTARTLVIAGGGGAGPGRDTTGWQGGGGGAGGYLASSSTSLSSQTVVPVTVGAGGVAGLASNVTSGGQLRQQTSGQNSVLGSLTAIGGGAGGSWSGAGSTGGSGGGGGMYTGAGGTGTTGQGFAGGAGAGSSNFAGGGGGGSASVGSAATGTLRNATGGAGGAGTLNDITGTSTRYAAGGNGAGCLADASTSTGGQTATGSNAPRNTGSGGGAGGDACNSRAFRVAGDGGSGVVIVRFASTNQSCDVEQTTQGAHVVVAFKTIGTCTWSVPNGVSRIDYLVVAGGGGGASRAGGGGGAGGYLTSTDRSVSGVGNLTITVGNGGDGAAASSGSGLQGNNGANSVLAGGGSFSTVTAIGGGGGGKPQVSALGGGSGGGASGGTTTGSSAAVGTGTSGQGRNGGTGLTATCSGTDTKWCAGGGGGAGAVGGNAVTNGAAGSGGAGLAPSWLLTTTAQRLGIGEVSGSSVFFAGGGGGGTNTGGTAGSGGVGGGGDGSESHTVPGIDAIANTGGGGGGSGYTDALGQQVGGNGGSGIVILRYVPSTTCEGVASYEENSYTVVAFKSVQSNCTWTIPSGVTSIDYLVVAGGGGGGHRHGGGGGAGGLLTSTASVTPGSSATITVGGGGTGGSSTNNSGITNGGNSQLSINSASIALAIGGGAGSGAAGGSGGGSAYLDGAPGTGTVGQGNNGGRGDSRSGAENECAGSTTGWCGGGGGGAGAAGENADNNGNNRAGNGGVGLTTSLLSTTAAQFLSVGHISGGAVYFAGGGGGGIDIGATAGVGGLGGGANGTAGSSTTPTTALANTGGGGGGGGYDNAGSAGGGAGGTGVVLIRYAASTSGTTAAVDSAAVLNGTSQFFEVAEGTAFVSRATYTVESWIYPTSTTCPSTSYCPFISHDGDYTLAIYENKLRAFIYHTNAGQYNTWATNITMRADEWQHVALVRDGSAARLYVNGQLRESTTLGGSARSTFTNQFPLWFGKHYANFFAGRIDHARIWSAARTEAQIAAAMHEHTPTTAAGLVAQYDFNGVTGTTVTNSAPSAASGTNLTANGSPTYVDIKSTSFVGSDVVVTFPRSYLTSAGGWSLPTGISNARALVVAGGGGGGSSYDNLGAGGGGAGGLIDRYTSTGVQFTASTIEVTVGAGGYGAGPNGDGTVKSQWQVNGANGQNSILDSLTAVGGGGGGNRGNSGGSGNAGGSGGGAGGRNTADSGGAATTGQGNVGGRGTVQQSSHGGGGGGAGGAGGNSNDINFGVGGSGRAIAISGASVTYAAGGNGGNKALQSTTTTSASANTGDGGTGGNGVNTGTIGGYGGNGGSGIVIVRYSMSPECVPVTSRTGVYVVTKFIGEGECGWTVPAGVTSLDYLVVGGGGGGGAYQGASNGGGGGAGGVLHGSALTVTPTQPLAITIGGGGVGGVSTSDGTGQHGTAGANSSVSGAGFTTLTAQGGGYGAGSGASQTALAYGGGAGASGGGALGSTTQSASGGTGVAGPPRQGYNGGANATGCGIERPSGGGGGAGAAGGNASCTNDQSGDGGVGRAISITGTNVFYGGGGGGGGGISSPASSADSKANPGSGGAGGGGNGGGIRGADGVDALGGGGGGAGYNSSVNVSVEGGNGGDGVVILRYIDRVVELTAGDDQAAQPSTQLPVNPKVRVVDAAGNPIDGVSVIFTVTAGGGAIGSRTVTTSGGGYAETTWIAGASGAQTLTATIDLVGSNTVTFDASFTSSVCDVGFDELNFDFSNKTVVTAANSSKPGFSLNDKILFRSVATKLCDGVSTAIDALVTTTALSNATITAYESGAKAGGPNSYFQADVDFSQNDGYAEFSFQFYENGTYSSTAPRLTLQNMKITAIDIDYYQYNYVTGIDSFTLASNTRIVTTRTPTNSFPADAKFQGPSGFADNDPRDQVVMGFGEVEEFKIRFGRSRSGSPNYFGVAFKELGWGTSSAQTTGEQFVLTYDENGATGGSAPDDQTSAVGGSVTTASNTGLMTRTGYTFAGWNTVANGTGTTYLSGSSFVMPQGGDTLYAQWTPTNYSVIYNANGGAGAPANQTAAFASTVTVAGAGSMTRTGYTFAGWDGVADGSGTDYAVGDTFAMPAANITLYAQWTLNTYTVTYDANNGTNPPTSTTANAGSTVTVAGAGSMTRTGYTFAGWNTLAGGTGTSRAAGSTFTLNADVTLYAQWTANTYTVTYNANGGTGAPSSQTKAYDSTVTVAGAGSMTRTGYTFSGWNTVASGVNGTSRAAGSTFTMPDENVTLYAQWTPNQHDVLYDANDTNLGAAATNVPLAQENNNFGSLVTLSSTLPTLAGYTFNGWNTVADGSGTSYIAGGSLTQPDGNVTLYAQWVADIYDLIYNANGGTGAPAPGAFGTGTTATVSLVVPTRTGFDFAGWKTSPSGSTADYAWNGSVFTPSSFQMPANDVTLYAHWEVKSYSVVYNGNGGGGLPNPSSDSKTYATTVTVSNTIPSRSGFEFTGWNTERNGSGTSYSGGGTFSMPAANVTLYAQWVANVYTVTYVANGGTTAPSSQTAATDSTVTVSGAGSMTRDGYTFDGWNTLADGTGTSRAAAATFSMPDANVILYAQWSATIQTVTYNANNGSGAPGSTTSPTDSTVTVSRGVPTRTGYAFVGWNTLADGTGIDYVGGDTFMMPSTDVTLYAKWSPLIYIVSYNANGGAGAPAQQSEFTGAQATVSATAPLRTGYSLVAWNAAANGTGTVYVVGGTFTMPAANVTLYAQWIANTNQVVYNATGGTGAPSSTSAITDSTVTVSSTTPTRSGYTFVGWNTAADGSGTSYSATDTFTMPGASVTLYAQWTPTNYTITYNANGGTTAPAAQIEPYLSNATLSNTLPVYAGYIFMGWTTAQNGTTNTYLNGARFLMPNNDVTLYAQWQADTYDLYFFANGGTGGTSSGEANTDDTVELATMVTSRPTRVGYTFAGWNTTPGGTGTNYAWNGSNYTLASFTMPATDVLLYAQWTPIDYTVTYDANDGSGTLPATVTANYQDLVFVSNAPGLSRNGFTFVGWNTERNRGGTDYAPTQNLVMPNNDVTLYAIWQANVNAIVYNPAGGTNAPDPQFAATSQVETVSNQVPERTGYTFLHWVDATGTQREPGDSLTMPATGTMLFAVWTINSYTLRYDVNGGSGNFTSESIEFGATATVTSTMPTRNGFTFAGWNTRANGTGTAYPAAGTFAMPGEDVTLYAQWSENPVEQIPAPAPNQNVEAESAPSSPAQAENNDAPRLTQTGIDSTTSMLQAFFIILCGAVLMRISRRRSKSLF